ncbi:MAG: carboxy-S-adenosyl-L-methionine synthase CmoA [Gammaproteobacteria bacterium]|nr:carboxy-S-adenosyl-L-methionine synthase CmoA [Gammaproteobacteria bacterium]
MAEPPRDRLFDMPRDMIVDFVFDEQVARVFPDMIRRSVPGYESILTLLGLFAQEYAQANTNLYDLGCSTGAATLALRRRISQPGCRIYAIDNSTSMVEVCRANLQHHAATTPVEVVCADIQQVGIENASLVVLNFTLQFIAPGERSRFLRKIYAGLNPGGVLVLSEKILLEDPLGQRFEEDLHLAFKKANGYSELEISQKRSALEKILIPETPAQHRQRLQQAGFQQVYRWFQALNFISFAAIK